MQLDGAPSIPRTAATVLVLRDDPFEVLMLRRHARATFPSMLVFPGGVVDPGDSEPIWDDLVSGDAGLTAEQRAIRIAGVRETWEESGLLIAHHGGKHPGSDASTPFPAVARGAGNGRIAVDELQHFAHWVTPELEPKRFDTRFYLVRAPEDQIARADGGETLEHRWVSPRELLERTGSDEPPLMFPTRLNLLRLAESENSEQAFAAARQRPRFTVRPTVERVTDGIVVSIPAETGYPVTEQFAPMRQP